MNREGHGRIVDVKQIMKEMYKIFKNNESEGVVRTLLLLLGMRWRVGRGRKIEFHILFHIPIT